MIKQQDSKTINGDEIANLLQKIINRSIFDECNWTGRSGKTALNNFLFFQTIFPGKYWSVTYACLTFLLYILEYKPIHL